MHVIANLVIYNIIYIYIYIYMYINMGYSLVMMAKINEQHQMAFYG